MAHTPGANTTPVPRFHAVIGDSDAWFRRIENGRTAECWSLPHGPGSGRKLGVLPRRSELLDEPTVPTAHDNDAHHREPSRRIVQRPDQPSDLRTSGGACQ